MANRLPENLDAEYFVNRMVQIEEDAEVISTAYGEYYGDRHNQRAQIYLAAITEIKGRSDWTNIPPQQQEVFAKTRLRT